MSNDLKALKEEIQRSIDAHSYYSTQLGQQITFDGDGWSEKLLCKFPGHTDSRPSLNVNSKTLGFKCFSCTGGTGSAGSIYDFHCIINGRDPKGPGNFAWALKEIAAFAGVSLSGREHHRPPEGMKHDTVNSSAEPATPKPVVNRADKVDANQDALSAALADQHHDALEAHHYAYLNQVRGLTLQTIQDCKIGFKAKAAVKTASGVSRGRYTIPIFNRNGELRNIRLYSPDAIPEQKMINTKGFGSPPRLYPLDKLVALNPENVIICEGEWDCILLNQKLEEAQLYPHWMAVTGTHGATTFEREWLEFLTDKHVYILYDADLPGRTASGEIATKFFLDGVKSGKYKSVRIVTLPHVAGTKEDKDVTDFFVKRGEELVDIITACKEAPPVEPGGMTNDDASVKPIEVENLISCVMDRQYIDKRVRVPITISGQTSRIFHATRSYQVVSCPAKDDCCSRDAGERVIPYGHEHFIASCMASRMQVQASLRCIACSSQQRCNVNPIKKVVMQEYYAHQLVQRWKTKENTDGKMENVQELTVIPVYVLQPESSMQIEPTNYMATGWIRSHPATQQAALFIENLEPLEDDWRSFKVDSVSIARLKKLREVGPYDIMEDITNNVTRIYKSNDILTTVLLTYLSPLWITFNNEVIRGWINACIIGDSGTGKSMTFSRIADWLQLGDEFSVLTGTRTGLLYSLKNTGKEWYVHIGKYVSCDSKIIAIDETQETPAEEIKKMANAMDTGRLQVNQVAQASYHTKTRTLFLMNPKGGKKISDFPYGCIALTECFDPMFIRRLDLAVFTVAKDDYALYNQVEKQTEAHEQKITDEDFKTLVHWAWTRKATDTSFTDAAIAMCMEKTTQLSEKYGHTDDIPLIDPQGFRKELARLATAYAIFDCNFTEDYTGVIVEDYHIEFIAEFLDKVYSAASCNLLQHSKQRRKTNRLEDFDSIRGALESVIEIAATSPNEKYRESQYFCQLLLLIQQQQTSMRQIDLQQQIGLSMQWLNKHLTILRAFNLIEFANGGYKTTRKFNLFMLEWMKSDKIARMFDQAQTKIGQVAMRNDHTSEWYGNRGTNNSGPVGGNDVDSVNNRLADQVGVKEDEEIF